MSRRYFKSLRARKAASARTAGRRRQVEQQAKAPARQLPLTLNVEALVEMSRQALSTFATEMGLLVAQRLSEDEVTQQCGERYERRPTHDSTRFGHQQSYVIIARQKASHRKLRMRYTDARGEAEIERYALLQSPDATPQAALNHIINGVSTPRYENVVHRAREGVGVKKSSILAALPTPA